MRFLKRNSTNLRNTNGKGVRIETNEDIICESLTSIQVPKGTSADRSTSTENGQIRYNTDLDHLEMFESNSWKIVRSGVPTPIIAQAVGTGDGVENIFGPLDNQDPLYPDPASASSMIVLIENVFQIPGVNYSLAQSSVGNLLGPNSPYLDGWYIQFTAPVPTGKPVTVIHNFDK